MRSDCSSLSSWCHFINMWVVVSNVSVLSPSYDFNSIFDWERGVESAPPLPWVFDLSTLKHRTKWGSWVMKIEVIALERRLKRFWDQTFFWVQLGRCRSQTSYIFHPKINNPIQKWSWIIQILYLAIICKKLGGIAQKWASYSDFCEAMWIFLKICLSARSAIR